MADQTEETNMRIMLFAVALLASAAVESQTVEIPYTQFQLDNGLTVIVHEDHKAPIVAVNIWYHVGSKDEKPGRTGFAHLFEHLMFNGSENYDDEYFEPFERIGVTNQNGTTSFDRTNYFQNVPTTGLDLALWMESDRMGHLLGAVSQERLDEQRGVVQNEKRQNENQPYGMVFNHLIEGIFPKGHPYSWLPIGSMEDLNAATLEDVKEWFQTYYGPNNAVLVLAGDITPEIAREKAELYFGDIQPGPPITRHDIWVPTLDGEHRETLQDRVPQTRIYKAWPAPEWANSDTDLLQLATSILGGGKNSRLYERLVYEDQTATSVGASVLSIEIAGFIYVTATVQPGGDAEAVEQAMDEEIARFLEKGPTREELNRVRTSTLAGFVRGAERVGGFGGKSDILAENYVYGGSPDFYKTALERLEAATPKSIQAAAKRWFTDGVYVLTVEPFDTTLTAKGEGADRSALPYPDTFPTVGFPEFERATLDNGLKLIVAPRDNVPLVNFSMVFNAGYAADQFGLPGTASLAMSMLDEGTKKRSALEISEALQQLGANYGAGTSLDTATISLNTLKRNMGGALDIYADIILNPAFPENELDRLRKARIAGIQRERTQPQSMALRVLPKLMYGEEHAYGQPLTGSGTEASAMAIDQAALQAFHSTWIRPNNATLIIVGDTTLEEIRPELEARFGKWEQAEIPSKTLAAVAQQEGEVLYVIDRPDSAQSMIIGGHVAPPTSDPADLAIEAANQVLGGDFSARLNLNLREDKNWSYGVYSSIVDAEAQRPFLILAPVQSDKTADAIAELRKELGAYLSDRPAEDDELERVKANNTLSLPGRWETIGAVNGSLISLVRFNLPDDHWSTFADRTRALTIEEVREQAERVIQPDRMIWVVVGDLAKIRESIEALGIGEIRLLDTDGNPID
ncbi:MAG: pitrilysin family protein [Pseudomonadota bacterium]